MESMKENITKEEKEVTLWKRKKIKNGKKKRKKRNTEER
jgi:hypothetical protein